MILTAWPLRASSARSLQRRLAVLALVLLLQPVLLTLAGGGWGGAMTPMHRHAALGAVPAHHHWYDAADEASIPPGCGGSHHDHHEHGGAQPAAVVCLPGDDIAGESITVSMLGATMTTTLLHGVVQRITADAQAMPGSWSAAPTTPPPQVAV